MNLKEEATKLETQLETSCFQLKLSEGEQVPAFVIHKQLVKNMKEILKRCFYEERNCWTNPVDENILKTECFCVFTSNRMPPSRQILASR